jgi:endonuclease G
MFLGSRAAMPKLSNAVRSKAFKLPGVGDADDFELKYHHFSVVMNAKARLAFVAAVNYDARAPFRHTREGSDRWFPDPRVDAASQAGNEFYSDNPLDRGHLVRRTDAAWGASEEEAKGANDDTFHFTNCSPQARSLQSGAQSEERQILLLWGNIEEHVACTGRNGCRPALNL